MSIVIRHGSNGAMKSATAVDAYMIPAIKEGRTIVTNIRGFTLERCYQLYPDLPESFEIINVNTESSDGKAEIAKWFHWVPKGALLVFDEASSLFPKAWRDKDIQALNYPGGQDQAGIDGRPVDWLSAWEMHRHYNWDIVLTTPNIKGIRDDIRGTTEMAYRHRNLGKLSEKFRMIKEVQHDAQKNGFSASDAISISTRRVSKDAFKLYDSTDTGLVKGSTAGKSLLADPKFLMLVAIILGVVALLGSVGTPDVLSADDAQAGAADPAGVPATRAGADVRSSAGSVSPADAVAGPVLRFERGSDFPVNDPFQSYRLAIVGTINDKTQIEASLDGDTVFLDPQQLAQLGYSYYPITDCLGKLVHGDSARLVTCVSNDARRLQSAPRETSPSDGPEQQGV